MILNISPISCWERSSTATSIGAFILTGSITGLLPRVSVVGSEEETRAGAVTVYGEISREKTIPLQVILLVPAILTSLGLVTVASLVIDF